MTILNTLLSSLAGAEKGGELAVDIPGLKLFTLFLLCSLFQALVHDPWGTEKVLKPPCVPDSTWIQERSDWERSGRSWTRSVYYQGTALERRVRDQDNQQLLHPPCTILWRTCRSIISSNPTLFSVLQRSYSTAIIPNLQPHSHLPVSWSTWTGQPEEEWDPF